jgi:hypothetical protein
MPSTAKLGPFSAPAACFTLDITLFAEARKGGRRSRTPKTQRPGVQAGPFIANFGGKSVKGLFHVLFRRLFRRRQAFQALEQLFLGHAVSGDLGIVGIDARPRPGAD